MIAIISFTKTVQRLQVYCILNLYQFLSIKLYLTPLDTMKFYDI